MSRRCGSLGRADSNSECASAGGIFFGSSCDLGPSEGHVLLASVVGECKNDTLIRLQDSRKRKRVLEGCRVATSVPY